MLYLIVKSVICGHSHVTKSSFFGNKITLTFIFLVFYVTSFKNYTAKVNGPVV